jgi:hypothetical protein
MVNHRGEVAVTAMNIVHMRVKPGREEDYLKHNRELQNEEMPGIRKMWIVKTGERQYCFVAEWDSFQSIVNARASMIKSLDGMRDMLEDLGGGRGVTEPYSGEAVVELG